LVVYNVFRDKRPQTKNDAFSLIHGSGIWRAVLDWIWRAKNLIGLTNIIEDLGKHIMLHKIKAYLNGTTNVVLVRRSMGFDNIFGKSQ
jgi:hypothetical protein